MLTHTLWRKIFPEEAQEAHSSANETIFELLRDKKWKAASEIAKFSLTEPMQRGISELDLRIRTINAAIGFKFGGATDEAQKHLNSIDWSASHRDFKLAIAVLREQFNDAAEIMRSIGKNGELITQLAYHQWPLFHKYRESKEFLEAYEEIYASSFIRNAAINSVAGLEKKKSELNNQTPNISDAIDKNEMNGKLETPNELLIPPTALPSSSPPSTS